MRVLTACEESQAVTIEMRRLGHEAYSCDIQECSGGHPEWHINGDALELINGNCRFQTMDGEWHEIDGPWDMLIAHPPCTHLAASGARHFAKKRADGRQQAAIEFFMAFINANCPRIVVENPVGIMSTEYRKPDQIISPWQYALTDEENTEKRTCLWFVGDVQPLTPTCHVKPAIKYHEFVDNKTGRAKRQTAWYYKTRCLGAKERSRAASKTFPGIARAMAEQWAGKAEEVTE